MAHQSGGVEVVKVEEREKMIPMPQMVLMTARHKSAAEALTSFAKHNECEQTKGYHARAGAVLKSRELIAMPHMLHAVKKWLSTMEKTNTEHASTPFWTEMDVKEMFPEIPRSDIIPALVWIHDQLKLSKKTRGPVEFYIAKDGNRRTDNTFHGSRDFFYKFTFQDIVHYMLFELHINDVFVSLSSVMSQNTGIPIGGSTSAQAASLVLIYRELRGDLPEMLKDLLWLRYRDNFLILHKPDSAGFSVDKWTERVQESFAKMTDMEITIEQQGQKMTFLECELSSPSGPAPLSLPRYADQPVQGSSPPQCRKMLDPTAPNAQCMLQSWIPSVVKKCLHYWITPETKQLNVNRVVELLHKKGMPTQWWERSLRKSLDKWGERKLFAK